MRRGRRAERGEARDMNHIERPPKDRKQVEARKNNIKKGE